MSNWVLLRGLTRESRHWGRFPEVFCRVNPGVAMVAPDLPGNGRLNGEQSPLRVEAMAEQVRADLAAQGLRPPCHLLAMSLGAMVASAWAERHPEEILGCVLINTSVRPFSPVYHRLKPASYAALLRIVLPGRSDWAREAAILELTSRHAEAPATVLDEWVGYRRQNPVSAGNALRQLVAAARYRAPLVKPQPPMLVLASERDALVDVSCSRRLAALWRTAFAEHPTAGHDIPLDDPAWVARQVRQWLGAATNRDRGEVRETEA